MSELNSINENGVAVSEGGLLNREQVAARYQVGIRTITNWMTRRVIPYIRVGHVIRFDALACDAALKAREVKCPLVAERGAFR